MATGKNTPQWQAFCEEARRILGSKNVLGGKGRSMHLRIDELAKVKQTLDAYQDEIDAVLYQQLAAKVEKAGRDAHQLALRYEKADREKDKATKEIALNQIEKLSGDIKALGLEIQQAVRSAGVSEAGQEGATKLETWYDTTMDQYELMRLERGHRGFQSLIKIHILELDDTYKTFLGRVKAAKNSDAVKQLEKEWTAWSEGKLKTLKQTSKDLKLEEEEETRCKSLYPSRFDAAESLISDLEDGGNDEDASTIKQALAEAERCATQEPPNWQEALRLIDEQLDQKNTYRSRLKTLQSNAVESFKPQCKLIETKLKEYKTKVDAGSHDAMALKYIKAKGQAGELNEAFPLNTLANELVTAISQAEKILESAQSLLGTIANSISQAAEFLGTVDHREIVEKAELLKSSVEAKRVDDVKAYFEFLSNWFGSELPRIKKEAQQAQQESDKHVDELKQKLKAITIPPEDQIGQSVLGEANSLLKTEIKQARESRNWTLVLSLVERASSMVDSLASRASQRDTNAEVLAQEIELVNDERLAVESNLQKLEQKVLGLIKGKALPPGTDAQALEAKCLDAVRLKWEKINTAWSQQQNTAVSVQELRQAGTSKALQELAKEISGIDPEAITSQGLELLWQEEYDRELVRLGMEATLKKLELADALAGVDFRRQLEVNRNAGGDWSPRIAKIDEIKKAIELKQQGRERALAELKRQALVLIQQADRLIKTAKARSGKFKAMIEECALQVADVRGIESYTNLTVTQDAVEMLTEVVGVLQSFDDRTGESKSSVLEGLWDGLQLKLKTHRAEMEKNTPQQLATLQQTLNDEAESIFDLKPSAFEARINGLDTEIQSILTEVNSVKAARIEVDRSAQHARERLQLLGIPELAPKYNAGLLKRIDDALKAAKTKPDAVLTSKTDLESLHRELDELKNTTGGEGIVEKTKEAQAEHLRQLEADANQKIQYETEYKVVDTVYRKKLTTALKGSMADTKHKNEFKRTLDMAQKSAKGKDYATALRHLEQLRQRVDNMVANPQGDFIGPRNALPKHAETYGQAVDALRAGLDEYVNAVVAVLSGREDTGTYLSKNSNAVESVKRLFDATLFVDHAARLSDEKVDDKARRAEREKALRRIRQQRQVMQSNAVLQALRTNPVYPRLNTQIEVVEKRLESLEANIRRCVQ